MKRCDICDLDKRHVSHLVGGICAECWEAHAEDGRLMGEDGHFTGEEVEDHVRTCLENSARARRTKLRVVAGTRVRFTRAVERYPLFVAPEGTTGTIVGVEFGKHGPLVRVRADQHLPGAEEWDNEVHWFEDCLDDVPLDLAPLEDVVGRERERALRFYERVDLEARVGGTVRCVACGAAERAGLALAGLCEACQDGVTSAPGEVT